MEGDRKELGGGGGAGQGEGIAGFDLSVPTWIHEFTEDYRRWLQSGRMRKYMQTHVTSFQLLANVMLYLCATTVGVMSYYMADRKYRTAFLEARQSLEVKLTLEEQSTQQVRRAHTHIHTITGRFCLMR